MKRTLTEQQKKAIADDVKQFIAEEFEMSASDITDETDLIDGLGADSLLFLEMIDAFKQRHGIELEVRIIGQFMMKKRIKTVGETLSAIYEIIEKGDELSLELAGEGSVGERVQS
jgi:acyl carrier protein